jgi:hypothetical protein
MSDKLLADVQAAIARQYRTLRLLWLSNCPHGELAKARDRLRELRHARRLHRARERRAKRRAACAPGGAADE